MLIIDLFLYQNICWTGATRPLLRDDGTESQQLGYNPKSGPTINEKIIILSA